MSYTIAAFYRFTPLDDAPALRIDLKEKLTRLVLCGTLLLAPEGINGTLAGTESAIDAMLGILHCQFGLPREDVKFSQAAEKPFNRLKIRLKREIITFNQPDADPSVTVGTRVEAQDWNELIADPEVLLIDTRNRYETRLGTFADALDPGIEHFSDFADYVRQNLDPSRHRKVAMFCTGGIRCEKASSFMLQEGFAEVYHLKGGILKYLEDVPVQTSRWQGDCYVFDHRMAVGPGLSTGRHAMCFSCGEALTEADRSHAQFEEGVSCHLCHASTSEADKARFRMRHAQITLMDSSRC
ncbi:MAG: rhodanese-related sulfurtransferase [Janthinobacterium lividum]